MNHESEYIRIYLLKSRPNLISYSYSNTDDIIESFIVNSQLITNEMELSNKLRKCDSLQSKALKFCRYCQKHYISYSEYPFDWDIGVNGYVMGNVGMITKFPTFEELEDTDTAVNWKHIDKIYTKNNDKVYLCETFANRWIYERNLVNGEYQIPYKIQHSLDNSSVCKLLHCFASVFKPYYELTGETYLYLTEQWVKANKNELTTEDINGFYPVELFNFYNPTYTNYGNKEYEKYLVERMRKLLEPDECTVHLNNIILNDYKSL